MSLTQPEIDISCMALGRIGAKQITLAVQTSVEGVQANLHYAHTRDSLLRSFDWNFAVKRLALVDTWITATTYTAGRFIWIDSQWVTGTAYTTVEYVLINSLLYKCTIAHTAGVFVTDLAAGRWTLQAVGTVDGSSLLYKCAIAHVSGVFVTDLTAVDWVLVTARPSFGYVYQYDLPSDCLRFRAADIDAYAIEGKLFLTDDQTVNIEYIYQCTTTTLWDTLFYEVMVLKLALNLLHPLAGTSVVPMRQMLEAELKGVMSKARVVSYQETNSSGSSDWNDARFD